MTDPVIHHKKDVPVTMTFEMRDDEGNLVSQAEFDTWTDIALETYIEPAFAFNRAVTFNDTTGGQFSDTIRVVVGNSIYATDVVFSPDKLKTMPNEIDAFVGRDNILSIDIEYEGQPLNLSSFYRFEFMGVADSAIDTDTNSGAVEYVEEGKIELNIGDLITRDGKVATTLIGYSPTYPDGVVLWHPSLPESRLRVDIYAV